MKNKEPPINLNDTITLADLKDVFSLEKCPNLVGKPKLLLLNGWKEGAEESLFKCDAGPTMGAQKPGTPDILAICSSFDNCATFLNTERLPPSLFPGTLLETILKYKTEPINNLPDVVSGMLLKSSKKTIKVKGKSISINESCMQYSTLQLGLHLCFKDRLVSFPLYYCYFISLVPVELG